MHDGPDFARLRRALLLEGEPDRVPLIEPQVEQDVKSAFLGKPVNDLATEVEFWVKAGYDYVPFNVGILSLLGFLRGSQYQVKEGMPSLAVERPGKAHYSLYTEGATERAWAEEGRASIITLEDFERFPWPEPGDFDLSVFAKVKQHLPPGMKAIPLVGFIFTPTWRMMGFEHFCASLTENPTLVERLFDKVGRIEYALVQRLVDYDSVGAIWGGSDVAYAEGLMIAPQYLRKYLFPWFKKIGDLCRAKGLPYLYHSDGKLYQVIDDLLACGVRALHPIEPKAMDISLLKKEYGDRLCLCGNIDLSYTLTLGTPEEVEAEVRQRLREIAPGGGYCLGSSNSVTEYVPLANYNAMREAALKYGRYPIRV